MRKITSLLTLLLLFAGAASAQITAVSEITETGIYTIKAVDTNRGALYYNSEAGDYVASTSKYSVTYDVTAQSQQWTFEPTGTDGQYYIKNVAADKYIGSTANPWTLADSKVSFTVEAGTAGGFVIKAAETGNLINISDGYDYGTNCLWNTQDNGNNFTITKVGDTEAETVEVTYTVTLNGSQVGTYTYTQYVGEAATLASTDKKAFIAYTYSPATLESGTTAVAVTATVNLPFTISSGYDNAKWYYLNFNPNAGKSYFTYDASATPNVKTPVGYTDGDENAQWAFVGEYNPYADTQTGLTLINKAAGADLVLASKAGAASDGNTGGNTYAVMDSESSTDNPLNKWTIAAWSAIDGGFTLANSESVNLNRRSANTLAYWTYTDAGSVITATAVPEDYSNLVNSNIAPYFADGAHGGLFQLKDEVYQQYASQVAAAQTSCTLETYKTLLAVVQNSGNLNYPESGYYRIKSAGARNGTTYLCVGKNAYERGDKATGYGLSTVDEATAASDASTFFKLTKTTADDGTTAYKLSSQGEGVVQPTAYNQPFLMTAEEDEGDDFFFTVIDASTGKVAIGDAAISSYQYLHEAGWAKNADGVVKWESSAGASQWYLEEAEDLTVALNAAGSKYYATLCLPFGADVKGATAYTAAQEDDVLKLTAIDAVPANTPVVLVGDAESATVSLNTEAAAAEGTNSLKGTNVAMDWNASYLTLGKVNEVAGFYTWNAETLGANKAYIAADAGSNGLAFSFGGVTGIDSAVSTDETAAKTYDLQGRRVMKASKGLYIIGGKKVLVK